MAGTKLGRLVKFVEDRGVSLARPSARDIPARGSKISECSPSPVSQRYVPLQSLQRTRRPIPGGSSPARTVGYGTDYVAED